MIFNKFFINLEIKKQQRRFQKDMDEFKKLELKNIKTSIESCLSSGSILAYITYEENVEKLEKLGFKLEIYSNNSKISMYKCKPSNAPIYNYKISWKHMLKENR